MRQWYMTILYRTCWSKVLQRVLLRPQLRSWGRLRGWLRKELRDHHPRGWRWHRTWQDQRRRDCAHVSHVLRFVSRYILRPKEDHLEQDATPEFCSLWPAQIRFVNLNDLFPIGILGRAGVGFDSGRLKVARLFKLWTRHSGYGNLSWVMGWEMEGHLGTTGMDALFQVGVCPKVVLEIMRATVLINASLLRGI